MEKLFHSKSANNYIWSIYQCFLPDFKYFHPTVLSLPCHQDHWWQIMPWLCCTFRCSHQSVQVPRNTGINYLFKLLPLFLEVCRTFLQLLALHFIRTSRFSSWAALYKAGSAGLKVSGLLAQLAAVHKGCRPGAYDTRENKMIKTTCMLKEVEDREDGWHGRFLTLPSGLSHVRSELSLSSGQLQ